MISQQTVNKDPTDINAQAFTYLAAFIILVSQLLLPPDASAQAEIEIYFEREFKTSGSESGLFDEHCFTTRSSHSLGVNFDLATRCFRPRLCENYLDLMKFGTTFKKGMTNSSVKSQNPT